MSINILMPALSPTMTEGKLAKWHVKVGDTVKAGQVICEIETDKATMEVEAVDEGKVGQIVVPEGTEAVKVNAVIAVLLEEGEKPANIIMAAVLAKGKTTIYNAACEPYIQQLCKMLNRMGAKITGIGSNLLYIDGVDEIGDFPVADAICRMRRDVRREKRAEGRLELQPAAEFQAVVLTRRRMARGAAAGIEDTLAALRVAADLEDGKARRHGPQGAARHHRRGRHRLPHTHLPRTRRGGGRLVWTARCGRTSPRRPHARDGAARAATHRDRKSTRLNSSHT